MGTSCGSVSNGKKWFIANAVAEIWFGAIKIYGTHHIETRLEKNSLPFFWKSLDGDFWPPVTTAIRNPVNKCTGFRFSNLIVMLVTMRPTGRNFKNIVEITTRKAHKYYRGRKCLSISGLRHKNHGNIYMHENVRRNMHVQNCPHNALYERRWSCDYKKKNRKRLSLWSSKAGWLKAKKYF